MGISDWTKRTQWKLGKQGDAKTSNVAPLCEASAKPSMPPSLGEPAPKNRLLVLIENSSSDLPQPRLMGYSLWDESYKRLSDDPSFSSCLVAYQQYVLEHAKSSRQGHGSNSADTLTSQPLDAEQEAKQIKLWVQAELENLSKRRFVLTMKGQKIDIRAEIYGVIQFIAKFKNVIGTIVATDSAAACVWGGVAAILPLLENIFEQDAHAATGFKQICYFITQANVVENRLRSTNGQITTKTNQYEAMLSAIEDHIINLYAQALRYQIQFLVQYARHPSLQSLRNAFVIDDWDVMLKIAEGSMKNILDGLQHLASDNIRTLCNELSTFAKDTELFQQEMHKDLQQIKDHGETAFLDKLPYVGSALFDSRALEEHGGCLAGTQIDTLNAIQRWLNDHDSRFIFWLYGLAGTGKSSIALTVAQALHQEQPLTETTRLHANCILGASYFFSMNDQYRNSTTNLFATIAWCLGRSVPPLKRHIVDAMHKNSNIANLAPTQQMNDLIIQPLSALEQESFSTIRLVIVLDALDECLDKDDVNKLLKVLVLLNELTRVQVRVFITSRYEDYIARSFDSIGDDYYQSLCLCKIPVHKPASGEDESERQDKGMDDNDEEIDLLEDDISKYLKTNLGQISIDRDFPEGWLTNARIQSLRKVTEGLFIYASVACRFLDHELYEDDLNERFKQILDGGADYHDVTGHPYGVYNSVLRYHYAGRLKGDRTQAEMKRASEEIKTLLGTIVMLSEPVSINTLNFLLPKPDKQLRRRLAAFGAVLNVPKNDYDILYVIHLSFREFILDTSYCPSEYLVDAKTRHYAIFDRCLAIMKDHLREDICSLKHPGTFQSQITSQLVDDCIPQYVQYACIHWIDHLENIDDDEVKTTILIDTGVVHNFLLESFLFWLEALSIIGKFSISTDTINRLDALISSTDSPQLCILVQDAIPFVRNNRQTIQQAPLQIYSSALIFSPSGSIIRQVFWKLLPSWVLKVPKAEKLWGNELLVLEHDGISVSSLKYSPDNTILATGSSDGIIRLWYISSGVEIHRYACATRTAIKCLSFSQNGKSIAFGTYEGLIELWEPATGNITELAVDQKPVQQITISPDGDTVATAHLWNSIELWSIKERRRIHTIEIPDSEDINWRPTGHILEFSSDGTVLLSSFTQYDLDSYEVDFIILWDVKHESMKTQIKCDSTDVAAIASSPTGEVITTASTNGIIKRWFEGAWRVHCQVPKNDDPISSIALSPDGGKIVATGHSSGAIKLHHVATGTRMGFFKTHTGCIYNLAFSSKGTTLASASRDSTARLTDVTVIGGENVVDNYPEFHRKVNTITFFPQNHAIVAVKHQPYGPGYDIAADDPSCGWTMWDWQTSDELSRRATEQNVQHLRFSPDKKIIATISTNKTLQFWNHCMEKVSEPFTDIRDVQFSPTGTFVGLHETTQNDEARDIKPHKVLILHSQTWNEVTEFEKVLDFGFSHQNRLVAFTTEDNVIHIWDIEESKQLSQAPKTDGSSIFRFAKNGEYLSHVSKTESFEMPSQGDISLVEVCTGKEMVSLTEWMTYPSMQFSDDSQYFAVITAYRQVNIWSTSDGSCLVSAQSLSGFSGLHFGSLLRQAEVSSAGAIGILLSMHDSGEHRVQSRLYFWDRAGKQTGALLVDAFLDWFQFSLDGKFIQTSLGVLALPSPSLGPEVHQVQPHEIQKNPIWMRGNWISQGFDNVLRIPVKYLQSRPPNHEGRFVLELNGEPLSLELNFAGIPGV